MTKDEKLIQDAMQAAIDWIAFVAGPNSPPEKHPALIERLKECVAIRDGITPQHGGDSK